MALKKCNNSTAGETRSHKRRYKRDYDGLISQLGSDDPSERRWAARDLVKYPETVEALMAALTVESEHAVREALFDTLQLIGGEAVITGLITLLRAENAELRNGAIEVMQSMPTAIADHIKELLNDRDSDVRIFAIDILQVLAHPRTPEWLMSVLKKETHINVIATAVDRISEVGTLDMLPEIEDIKRRFSDEPYLTFAVDTAIKRIKEE
jgi:HEAT repeat protein